MCENGGGGVRIGRHSRHLRGELKKRKFAHVRKPWDTVAGALQLFQYQRLAYSIDRNRITVEDYAIRGS
jgi:hypothetical protein